MYVFQPSSPRISGSIPFSGGPWKLQSWSKDQTVLVRNDAYWGHKPFLDQVTIVPRTDAATEINSLLSGDVSAIFPQPGTTSFVQQFASVPAIKFKADPGTVFYEALWMNLSKFPFNDKAVREALFWGTDRQAVIDGLIKKNNPNATVLGCGVIAFPGTPWCDGPNGTPYAQFHFDATKVSDILTAAGWAKDSAGFWAKGGKELAFTYDTTTKDRRIATQALLKEKFAEAGFKVTLKVDDATLLFETKLPKGDFQVADFAEGGSVDPSVTGFLSCKTIPTAANGYAGANDFHWCNPAADTLETQSDQRALHPIGVPAPGAHLLDPQRTLSRGRQHPIAARFPLTVFACRGQPTHASPPIPASRGTESPPPRCPVPARLAARS